MLEFIKLTHKYILFIHIVVGTVSLITFLLPLFFKKGGNLHRKIGWVYVYTMWGVLISAGILSICNVFLGKYTTALFLGFLTVLTALPLWSGIAILKYKKSLPDSYIRMKRILSLPIFLFGILNMGVGFYLGFNQGSILIFFGVIGLITGKETFYSAEKHRAVAHWFNDHINGMVVGGIAAYTAFFAFGGNQLFGAYLTNGLMFIPWVMPTFIGIGLMRYYKVKVKK